MYLLRHSTSEINGCNQKTGLANLKMLLKHRGKGICHFSAIIIKDGGRVLCDCLSGVQVLPFFETIYT